MDHDATIVELCQRGHPAGFRRLVVAYQERIFRTAFAFVRNREDARDITQEVFLRTIRAIDSLDPTRPLWPWLRRVTANLAINLIRRRSPHLSLDDLPDSVHPSSETGEPSWTLIDLQAALADLAPLWRIVLILRHQEGLPYEEIARITDLPVGTVKTYIFRGRRMLREKLARWEV